MSTSVIPRAGPSSTTTVTGRRIAPRRVTLATASASWIAVPASVVSALLAPAVVAQERGEGAGVSTASRPSIQTSSSRTVCVTLSPSITRFGWPAANTIFAASGSTHVLNSAAAVVLPCVELPPIQAMPARAPR